MSAVYGDAKTGTTLCATHKPVPEQVLVKRIRHSQRVFRRRLPVTHAVRRYNPIPFRRPTLDARRKVPPKQTPAASQLKCHYEACNADATVGYPKIKAAYCRAHRLVTMGYTPCTSPGCTTRPSFGFQKPPVRCGPHRLDGMFNVNVARCYACPKVASFRLPPARLSSCYDHSTAAMVSRSDAKPCADPACTQVATHGWYTRIMCSDHRIHDMRVITGSCQTDGCMARATYGVVHLEKCKAHRTDEMRYYPRQTTNVETLTFQ